MNFIFIHRRNAIALRTNNAYFETRSSHHHRWQFSHVFAIFRRRNAVSWTRHHRKRMHMWYTHATPRANCTIFCPDIQSLNAHSFTHSVLRFRFRTPYLLSGPYYVLEDLLFIRWPDNVVFVLRQTCAVWEWERGRQSNIERDGERENHTKNLRHDSAYVKPSVAFLSSRQLYVPMRVQYCDVFNDSSFFFHRPKCLLYTSWFMNP